MTVPSPSSSAGTTSAAQTTAPIDDATLALLTLESRIHSLENLVLSPHTSSSSKSPTKPKLSKFLQQTSHKTLHNDMNNQPLLKRLTTLTNRFHLLVKQSKDLSEFMNKYSQIETLLPNTLLPSPSAVSSNSFNALSKLESESLPPSAKQEIILSAYEDLLTVSDQLKQLQSVKDFIDGVAFRDIPSHSTQIASLEDQTLAQQEVFLNIRERIWDWMELYNGFVETVSLVFIQYHEMLNCVENEIAEWERAKKGI